MFGYNETMYALTPAHLDHGRAWQGFDYCYPVISRRSRGLSLGVNLSIDKVCNFDCAYCEADRKSPPNRADINLGQLGREMEKLIGLALSKELFSASPFSGAADGQRRLNDMAFSGDGEPTAAAVFQKAVNVLVGLKKGFKLDDVKLVLITNATKFQDAKVIEGIDELMENNGEIWAKLDTGTEELYQAINRSNIPYNQIIDNLVFAGRRWPLIIQTLYLDWEGSPPPQREINQYIDKIKYLLDSGAQIKGLHLYTAARPTPVPKAKPLSSSILDKIALSIKKEILDVPLDVFYGPTA
jgi:wyosine [tRNA(Phe)-imidazoG37] synthetase (radical SAM superfamily)